MTSKVLALCRHRVATVACFEIIHHHFLPLVPRSFLYLVPHKKESKKTFEYNIVYLKKKKKKREQRGGGVPLSKDVINPPVAEGTLDC